MYAKDVMSPSVITVEPNTPVREVARTLLQRRVSAVPVVEEDGRLVGIVSEGDLIRRPESETQPSHPWWVSLLRDPEAEAREYVKSHGLVAQDVMTRGVITVSENTSLQEIAALLEHHRIKRVPVMREGKLVGIVSRANLLHGLAVADTRSAPAGDDSAVRDAVLTALREAAADRSLLNVVVSARVVHLWGVVGSESERQAALLAARRTSGVAGVEDHLGILPAAGMWGI